MFYRQATASLGESRRLWRHELETGKNLPLTQPLDYSFDQYAFSPDSRSLWLLAEEQGVLPLFKINLDGSGFTKTYGEGTSTGLDAAGGVVAFLNETFNRPGELFVLDAATGKARQLTHFNDEALAQLNLGKVERHTFAGADGREVQLWLIYPPGYDSSKKYPLVQLLHGGPHTMVRDAFSYRWNAHVFASPGYFVAWVNRHGSTGFGEKFAKSILGEWGEKPLADVLQGTDYLLGKFPSIDRDRLAAAGASYGGYLAAWIARAYGSVQVPRGPRRCEQLLHPVRRRPDQLCFHGGSLGWHSMEECGRHAAEQSDVLRQELQDTDADHSRREGLSSALRQWAGALRRSASHGSAFAAGGLSE